MKCKKCGNENRQQMQQFGKTAAGKQRYRCVNTKIKCLKTFTDTEAPRQPVSPLISCPKCPPPPPQMSATVITIVRAGKTGTKQRYKCKSCGYLFITNKTAKNERKRAEPDMDLILRVLNAVLGRGLSINQASKRLKVSYSSTRRLLWQGFRFWQGGQAVRLRKKWLSEKLSPTARVECSKIEDLNKHGFSFYLKKRGAESAVTLLKKRNDKAAKEALKKLDKFRNYYKQL